MSDSKQNNPPTPSERIEAIFVKAISRFTKDRVTADFKATYAFVLMEETDVGGTLVYGLKVENRQIVRTSGFEPGALVVTMKQSDFLALADGRLGGQKAFTDGLMRIDGDLKLTAFVTQLFK